MKNYFKNLLISALVLVICTFISFLVNAQQGEKLPELNVQNVQNIQQKEEKVIISIVNFGRENPFEPYKEVGKKDKKTVSDEEDIPYPPDLEGDSSEANSAYKKLTGIKVNGILYDPDSKSVAIINIDGGDFMMHKGDSIQGVEVLNIAKNSVTLRYGANTYNVGVGEIAEGEIKEDPVIRKNSSFGGSGTKLPELSLEGLEN